MKRSSRGLFATLALLVVLAPLAAQAQLSRELQASKRPVAGQQDAGKTSSESTASVLSLVSTSVNGLTIGEETAARLKAAERIDPIGFSQLGESISPYNGSVKWRWTDVALPESNQLKVEFARDVPLASRTVDSVPILASGGTPDIPHVTTVVPRSWAGGWTFNLPAGASTSGIEFEPLLYSQGFTFHAGGNAMPLLERSSGPKQPVPGMGGSFQYVTANLWMFQQVTAADGTQSLVGYSPDGLKYTFNKFMRLAWSTVSHPYRHNGDPQFGGLAWLQTDQMHLYVTKVEDRFGNRVDYTWDGMKLTAITEYDASNVMGRQIAIHYGNDSSPPYRIASVVANGRTWTYSDNGVINPDGSRWNIQGSSPGDPYEMDWVNGGQYYIDPIASCVHATRLKPNFFKTLVVQLPSGATLAYKFQFKRFFRTNAPFQCMQHDDVRSNWNVAIAPYEDVWALVERKLEGPGLAPMVDSYTYELESLGFQPGSNWLDLGASEKGPVNYRVVTISHVDGSRETKYYGRDWGVNDTQLLQEDRFNANQALVRRTQFTYLPGTDVAVQPFPFQFGVNTVPRSDQLASYNIPLRQTVTTQDGTTFTQDVNGYDTLARPTNVRRWNSLGFSRQEVTTYHDSTSKWVLGQVASVYNPETNRTISETHYDPTTALPMWTKSYGKLKQTLTYNPDGTVATAADGKGNTTTFSNYMRGIPRRIGHPDGTAIHAQVDGNGWISWVMDENGFTTNYNYDPMGRLSQITYPVGDTVAWTPTQISFAPSTAPAYGLPAGFWRQITQTGNARKIIVFDALWRPVVEETYDAANMGGTLSQKVTRYDAQGRVSFVSYPQRQLNSSITNNWANPNVAVGIPGTRSFYDPLDRLIRTEQDSELGNLITYTEYLPGLKVKVTNPRSQATTTSYMAFDQPSYDQPVLVEQPEGAKTFIARDVLGFPNSIQRTGTDGTSITRRYNYNTAMEVCRVNEPETGDSVMEYDAAGNLSWSAAGLTLANPGCGTTTAYASGRRVDRTYDTRNRLKTLAFPDQRGNQQWFYYPDGKVQQIHTGNGVMPAVVNAYTYNRRRMLTGESQATVEFNWTQGTGYDVLGNASSEVYPAGLTVWRYPNALGQPVNLVANSMQVAANISRYPNGAIASFTYGNGIVHTMTQNARQLPAKTVNGNALNLTMSYDPNGNVAGIVDGIAGSRQYHGQFVYDGLDRLKQVSKIQGLFQYTYDAQDNIKTATQDGVTDEYIYHPTNNRLTAIRSRTTGMMTQNFGYDAQGNVNTRSSYYYDFDYGNRLRKINAPNGEQYAYDGLGRRTTSLSNAGRLISMYSQNGQIRMLRDERRSQRIQYIYLDGSVVAQHRRPIGQSTEGLNFMHTDLLGSAIAQTDQTGGTVMQTSEYAPYGKLLNRAGNDRIDYTGHMLDVASGLVYAQQRYLDPTIGRFLSVDPVAANPNTGASFNRYAYANNNPYAFKDPDGRDGVRFYTDSNLRMAQPTCSGTCAKIVSFIADFVPVLGDAKGAVEAYQNPSPTNVIGAVIGVVPGVGDAGKLALKHGDEAVSAGRSLKQQASDLVDANGGRSRVELRSPSVQMRVDLKGADHAGVPTPHTSTAQRNLNAPNQPAYNTRTPDAKPQPSTQQEIRTVRRYLERKNP